MFRLQRLANLFWEQIAPAGGFTVLTFALSITGWLQPLEWFTLDQFLRLNPSTAVDSRILIVTMDEPDINYIGEWPIPDATLAKLLEQISSAEPRSIGLDIYRNLPVGEGWDDLSEVFRNTPTLVGVEKIVGQPIGPPPGTDPKRQVGMSDAVVDNDGRIRRALLAVQTSSGERKYGLATRLAFNYLEQENIYPKVIDEQRLQLGKATLRQLHRNDGGYANADTGGSQILINYPAGNTWFETVSMRAILKGQVPAEKIQDRVVLIGTTAISLNDFFYTPMSQTEEMPGVFVHAHIVSQLLGAALDGRTVLNGLRLWKQGLWILALTLSTNLVLRTVVQPGKTYKRQRFLTLIWLLPVIGTGQVALAYGLFTLGLWVPIMAPLLSSLLLSGLFVLQQNQKLQGLAAFDELTQIANRRSFDQYIQERISQQQPFTLVMCDVDYFKKYNDTYGHQAGDTCLQAIGKILKQGVRQSDLAARYGGEEFSLVLNNSSEKITREILERIQTQLAALQIEHEASEVNTYVTLSFGAAILYGNQEVTVKSLIECADKALYQAKQQGRNQFCFSD